MSRQKLMRKRSLFFIGEHLETIFNEEIGHKISFLIDPVGYEKISGMRPAINAVRRKYQLLPIR